MIILIVKNLPENLQVWLNLVTFAAMNKKEKLIKRFKTTSGSRVKFYNAEDQNVYIMHKPHPSNIIKGYMMRDILNYLLKNNYIN